jgi:hypothetical protein
MATCIVKNTNMYLSILEINTSWNNRWHYEYNTSWRVTFSDFFNNLFHIFLKCFTRNFRNIICTNKNNNIVIFTIWRGNILQLPKKSACSLAFLISCKYLLNRIKNNYPLQNKIHWKSIVFPFIFWPFKIIVFPFTC